MDKQPSLRMANLNPLYKAGDRLLAVARVAQALLRPGRAESERILVDGRKRLREQQVVVASELTRPP